MDVNARLDDVNRQMEAVRKEIIDVVQKTNSGLAKSLDARLEEQHKALADTQARTEQLSAKFAQFSQSLTAFQGFADRPERADKPRRAGRKSIGDSYQ